MKIGVFDSGVGGLTILRELITHLPDYDYIYLADNARAPYGDKQPEVIYQYTKQAAEFFFKSDCLLIILACNTATAAALRRLQQEYLPYVYPERRILGIIRPTVEYIAFKGYKTVGVIGTESTVKSRSFEKEIHKLNPHVTVLQYACPLLASCIERGETGDTTLTPLLVQYLEPFRNQHIDALILGCTHYSLIDQKIKKLLPYQVEILSEGPITASKLAHYLKRHADFTKQLSTTRTRTYFASEASSNYARLLSEFLEQQVDVQLAQAHL